MKDKVSFVIPAYNEVETLENAVRQLDSELKKIKIPYEILIAEQCSTDGTVVLGKKLEKKFSNLKFIHFNVKGKGNAITQTFLNYSEGNILAFMDADVATDIIYVSPLINSIVGGADIAIGSRRMKGSVVQRSSQREIVGRAYMLVAKLLFRLPVSDLQCGFKAFKKNVFRDIADYIQNTQLSWDTEVLVLANRLGYKIVEFPVKWSEFTRKNPSKVKLLKDSWKMGTFLFSLWWRLRKIKSTKK